jgi:hypothetical protein
MNRKRKDPTFEDFLQICKEADSLLTQIRKFPKAQGRRLSLLLILTASIIIAGALAKNSVKLNPWLMAACIVNLINVPF